MFNVVTSHSHPGRPAIYDKHRYELKRKIEVKVARESGCLTGVIETAYREMSSVQWAGLPQFRTYFSQSDFNAPTRLILGQ